MNSHIYEISHTPIPINQHAKAGNIPDWFYEQVCSYAVNTDQAEREGAIQELSKCLGRFCVRRGDEFILSSQMKEAFFRCRYHYFKAAAEILAQIDFDVFAGFSVSCAFHLALAGLNDSYEDRHGIYIYSTETEELVTLERWLLNADLTHPFYIGGAIAYYC